MTLTALNLNLLNFLLRCCCPPQSFSKVEMHQNQFNIKTFLRQCSRYFHLQKCPNLRSVSDIENNSVHLSVAEQNINFISKDLFVKI